VIVIDWEQSNCDRIRAGKKDSKCNPIQFCANLRMSGEDFNSAMGKGPEFIEIPGKKIQLSELTSALLLSVSNINHGHPSEKKIKNST